MEPKFILLLRTRKKTTNEENSSLKIVIKSVHLKPGSTKLVQATVDREVNDPPQVNRCGLITPNAELLAANQCDFQVELWNGEKDVMVSLTNWGNLPVRIKKLVILTRLN